MNMWQTLRPDLRRNLLTLFVAGLFFWSSLSSLLPITPLYVKSLGGSTQEIGIVMGAFAIGLLVFRNWVGYLADERGRKLVMLIGVVVAVIAPLGYIYAQTIPLLIICRAFHGLSVAAFALGYSALITDLAPIQVRGELIGYMSLVNPVGVAIGPALGGFLQGEFGFVPAFYLSSGLGLVGLLCTCYVKAPPPTQNQRNTLTGEAPRIFWGLLLSPRIRIPALVLLLVGLVFGTVITFTPLLLQELDAKLNVGFFYTVSALASFSIRFLIGRFSDRYGRGIFITLSLCCYTLSMILLATTTQPALLLGAAVLEGMGGGTLIPMMVTLMSDRSETQERGRVLSLSLSGFDVGMGVAGPGLGFLAGDLGYSGLFRLATGFSVVALIVFLTQSSKNLKESFRFATGQCRDIYAIQREPAPSA